MSGNRLTGKPSTVLFDLDGTLLDTAPDFVACLNTHRRQEGLPGLPAEEIRRSVTNGAQALVKLGFNLEPGHDDYERLHKAFLDHYEAHLATESCLFPGMDALLNWLDSREIPWGVVTNKAARFAEPLLEKLNLVPRCKVIICPDHVRQRKPHPESLLLAGQRLGVDLRRGIYVGDHLRDIEAGREAGMMTVAARYGYIEEPDQLTQWRADLVIDDAWGLLQWLQKL